MAKNQPKVIDSSVAVKWLNRDNEDYLDKADKLLKDQEEEKVRLVAPELSKYEVGNTLRFKRAPLEQAMGSLASYYNIPIEFVPMDESLARATMEIAYKNNVTFYDASFLALAQKLGAQLVTANPKHQKQIAGVKVVSLKDY